MPHDERHASTAPRHRPHRRRPVDRRACRRSRRCGIALPTGCRSALPEPVDGQASTTTPTSSRRPRRARPSRSSTRSRRRRSPRSWSTPRPRPRRHHDRGGRRPRRSPDGRVGCRACRHQRRPRDPARPRHEPPARPGPALRGSGFALSQPELQDIFDNQMVPSLQAGTSTRRSSSRWPRSWTARSREPSRAPTAAWATGVPPGRPSRIPRRPRRLRPGRPLQPGDDRQRRVDDRRDRGAHGRRGGRLHPGQRRRTA